MHFTQNYSFFLRFRWFCSHFQEICNSSSKALWKLWSRQLTLFLQNKSYICFLFIGSNTSTIHTSNLIFSNVSNSSEYSGKTWKNIVRVPSVQSDCDGALLWLIWRRAHVFCVIIASTPQALSCDGVYFFWRWGFCAWPQVSVCVPAAPQMERLEQVSLWSECIIQARRAGAAPDTISQNSHFSAPAALKQHRCS